MDDADFVMAEKTERRVKSLRTPTEEENADGAWYLNYDDGKGGGEKRENSRLEGIEFESTKDKWMTAADRA